MLEPSEEGDEKKKKVSKWFRAFTVALSPSLELFTASRRDPRAALSRTLRITPFQLEMDAALAAVLPWPVSLGAEGAAATATMATRAGASAGSTSTSTSTPSCHPASTSPPSPKLRGLVLVSDSLGADAAFVISHLLLKSLRDGRRVVLVAAAESGHHYEAVLKKLGVSASPSSSSSSSSSSLSVVPLWDDDALWMPDSMRTLSCGATGLRRAAQAIAEAVRGGGGDGEGAEAEDDEGYGDDENENNTALVFDSLSALQAAARSESEWEGFVAREVLGAAATCVIARTDCVPGDEARAADEQDDGEGDGGGAGDAIGSSSSPSSSPTPPWLSALRSSASVELTTRPLASGAAIDVSGVLVARRGVTATRRPGGGGATTAPPSLAPLSLVSTPCSLALPPSRSRAIFNYRLVDAAVRLTPRRSV